MTRFAFNAFEFPASHDNVYVYCNATFCKTSDVTSRCSQTCSPHVSIIGRGIDFDANYMVLDVERTFRITV